MRQATHSERELLRARCVREREKKRLGIVCRVPHRAFPALAKHARIAIGGLGRRMEQNLHPMIAGMNELVGMIENVPGHFPDAGRGQQLDLAHAGEERVGPNVAGMAAHRPLNQPRALDALGRARILVGYQLKPIMQTPR